MTKRVRLLRPGYLWATIPVLTHAGTPPCIWGKTKADAMPDADELVVRVYVCEAKDRKVKP